MSNRSGSEKSSARQVRVTVVKHQVEAEFVQQLLLDAGITSVLKRTTGFDVPDMLTTGPRDVMVRADRFDEARAVLLQARGTQTEESPEAKGVKNQRARVVKLVAVVVLLLWVIGIVGVLLIHSSFLIHGGLITTH